MRSQDRSRPSSPRRFPRVGPASGQQHASTLDQNAMIGKGQKRHVLLSEFLYSERPLECRSPVRQNTGTRPAEGLSRSSSFGAATSTLAIASIRAERQTNWQRCSDGVRRWPSTEVRDTGPARRRSMARRSPTTCQCLWLSATWQQWRCWRWRAGRSSHQ
jgi:hypothetical protein